MAISNTEKTRIGPNAPNPFLSLHSIHFAELIDIVQPLHEHTIYTSCASTYEVFSMSFPIISSLFVMIESHLKWSAKDLNGRYQGFGVISLYADIRASA